MSDEKQYARTLVRFEVLTEEPIDGSMSLRDIYDLVTEGSGSGMFQDSTEELVDEHTMGLLLENQGSSPGFLIQDENGDELEREYPPLTREVTFLLLHANRSWAEMTYDIPVTIRGTHELLGWARVNRPGLAKSGFLHVLVKSSDHA
jgi:hypothetical protein